MDAQWFEIPKRNRVSCMTRVKLLVGSKSSARADGYHRCVPKFGRFFVGSLEGCSSLFCLSLLSVLLRCHVLGGRIGHERAHLIDPVMFQGSAEVTVKRSSAMSRFSQFVSKDVIANCGETRIELTGLSQYLGVRRAR